MCLAVIATTLLIVLPLLYFFYPRSSSVPSLSIFEFLPNGLLHPIVQDPRNFQRTMKNAVTKCGRVFYFWMGVNNLLLTAVPEDIYQIMSSENFRRPDSTMETFRTMAPFGLVSRPAEERRPMRTALRHRFGPSALKTLHPLMHPILLDLARRLKDAANDLEADGKPRPIDISAALSLTSCNVLTNVAFGIQMNEAERARFAKAAYTYFDQVMMEVVGYPIRRYLTCFGVRKIFLDCKKEFDKLCLDMLQKRLNETEEEKKGRHLDVLDIFIDLVGTEDNKAASLMVEFSLGGSHTSAQLVAWSIYETCGNERVQQQIDKNIGQVLGDKPWDEALTMEELEQLTYINSVWKETLRLHHVGGGGTRTALADVTLKGSGVRIAKGQQLLLFVPSSQVDPAIWNDSTEFRPERWGTESEKGEGDTVPPGAYLPFSVGALSCGGRVFAEYEGPLFLAELHRRFKFSLACERDEVVSCSSFVECPRYASKKGGEWDMGVPVLVELK